MSRTKDERDRDRADLLAVLDQHTGPLTTRRVAVEVYGDVTQGWRHERLVLQDLNALAREGEVTKHRAMQAYSCAWQRATPAEVQDQAEVRRLMAGWEG